VVVMAASVGGPNAIDTILSGLPDDLPVPVLVVQHMAPGFLNSLADWLNQRSKLQVKIAENGEILKPGHVYLAADGRHLGVSNEGRVSLSASPPIAGFRPSANHLFRSASMAYDKHVLAIILTGMGNDGEDGLRSIRERDGFIIAQDEESCVVYGMPGAAVTRGIVDQIVPLDQMALWISELVSRSQPH
ncbi:MAG TPA: CheB methylesterase domain-containing protein, partial [Chroococcales cyanobacterium]